MHFGIVLFRAPFFSFVVLSKSFVVRFFCSEEIKKLSPVAKHSKGLARDYLALFSKKESIFIVFFK